MNGLRTLQALNATLGEPLFDRERLLVVDPDLTRAESQRRPEWREIADLFGGLPLAIGDFDHARSFMRGLRAADPECFIIIYDASPSPFHNGHLVQIAADCDPRTIYLGEKPIFTALADVQIARQFPPECSFCCDLIETESPVFRNVAEHLDERQLRLEKIWMWRAGSSAIRKALRVDREVAMGGALEDKSLHDFSITLGWLGGPRAIKDLPQKRLQVSAGGELCVSERAILFNEQSLLSMNNGVIRSFEDIPTDDWDFHRDQFPADVLSHVECDWVLADRTVPANYLFSWVGMTGSKWEKEFARRWKSICPGMEFPMGHSCETNYVQELGRTVRCQVQEVRLAILDCSGPTGREAILCNFLAKENYPGIRKFAKSFSHDKKLVRTIYEDPVELDRAVKVENLADIFKTLLQDIRGEAKANYIDREATLLTHELMLRSHQRMREQIKYTLQASADPAEWWRNAYTSSLSYCRDRIQWDNPAT